MATKDERPGLLSKVAMFVRNPTKDWSELDQLETRATDPQESGYDRQALKTMIERKRQNDFVRKREFDQLRKLRNRAPGTPIAQARPSFFQTSLPMEDEGRSVTLKKIDEIEAQMSKQWWKGKQAGANAAAAPAGSASAPTQPDTAPNTSPDSQPVSEASMSPSVLAFAATVPFDSGPTGDQPVSDFASTQTVPDMVAAGAAGPSGSGPSVASEFGFSMSTLPGVEEAAPETDSELEEAAIRFANSEDSGAERCLLDALRELMPHPRTARTRAEALLDFYRITDNRAAFDGAAQEFSLYLDQARPQWQTQQAATPTAAPAPAAATPNPVALPAVTWHCPAELDAAQMENLREVMMASAQPWLLDWSTLQRIAPSALPLLGDLFTGLCEEPLTLLFFAGDHLVQTLRAMQPTGDRAVDEIWWQTRLSVLRVLRMQDDFELAALDFCVNFGVAPPVWSAALCNCRDVPPALWNASQGAGAAGEPDQAAAPQPGGGDVPLRLHGEMLGDVAVVLAQLDAACGQRQHILVNCDSLRRVDFAAAGSILNWVVTRHSEGKLVQFQNVNRLVGAFFGVIGVHEHAKVVLRAI